MPGNKSEIIAKLQRDLINIRSFTTTNDSVLNARLGPMKNAFPNASFPLGAIHEFITSGMEDAAATKGFIAVLLASLMKNKGTSIWINPGGHIFPPALTSFGISPDKIIFIKLVKEKEILWTMEEALRCNGISAVIAELQEVNFTASRRLQLAVEKSHVTGFVIRTNPRSLHSSACVSRWRISPLSSELPGAMPGVGFPRWNVELLKVRNGKPGTWQIEFFAGRFKYIKIAALSIEPQKKTG